MAYISVTNMFVTSLYNVPYNAGSTFGDSPIYDYPEDTFFTQTPSGNVAGISCDWAGIYTLGDGSSYISIGSNVAGIEIKGISITSPTAGALVRYLNVNINGVDQKIKLFNIS